MKAKPVAIGLSLVIVVTVFSFVMPLLASRGVNLSSFLPSKFSLMSLSSPPVDGTSPPVDGGSPPVSDESPPVPNPKLFVSVPGINTTGDGMKARMEKVARYDPDCEVLVQESAHLSPEAVKSAVMQATEKAKEKGKDVIVHIDMDLEIHGLLDWLAYFLLPESEWHKSTRWAGGMINIVADAFEEKDQAGTKLLYSHSAGGDAVYKSIDDSSSRIMYDNINIFNGRTDSRKLKRALKSKGYSWKNVKVFTNHLDEPSWPIWSTSDWGGAKRWGRNNWVTLYSPYVLGHSGLIEFDGTTEFKAWSGKLGEQHYTATVEAMMLKTQWP